MKKTISLCISGLLIIGGLNANPIKTTNALPFGYQPLNARQVKSNKHTSFAKKSEAANWQEGNMIFTLGYGFPNIGKELLSAGNGVSNFKATGFGPLHFRFEYALSESFGIGLSSNFNKYGWGGTYTDNVPTLDVNGNQTYDINGNPIYHEVNYDENVDVTSFNILVRFNKHWAAGSKADIFSGAGFGYNSFTAKYTTTNPNGISDQLSIPFHVGFETTIGVRIFFTENFVGYVEAGWAKSIIQAGIGYKL